jgi:hypothetical protein
VSMERSLSLLTARTEAMATPWTPLERNKMKLKQPTSNEKVDGDTRRAVILLWSESAHLTNRNGSGLPRRNRQSQVVGRRYRILIASQRWEHFEVSCCFFTPNPFIVTLLRVRKGAIVLQSSQTMYNDGKIVDRTGQSGR